MKSNLSKLPNDVAMPMIHIRLIIATILVVAGITVASAQNHTERVMPDHGIAMHGTPALPAQYHKFDYADAGVLKTGRLRRVQIGSFDSLNPFAIRGKSAADIRALVFESLMVRHLDEPFSLYGLIAESIEVPPGREWVRFHLRPDVYFSDGVLLSGEDVIFSWRLLRDKGLPNHRFYYQKVVRAYIPSSGVVQFDFDPSHADRELPLLLGLMPILPKHIYSARDIEVPSLDIPVGSGAYQVSAVDPGRRVVFSRNSDYWGRVHPANLGRYNFETITDHYYRDIDAGFEAFKVGHADIWLETDPQRWRRGYDFTATRSGEIVRHEVKNQVASGLRAIVFNTRHGVFRDIRVRRALDLLFDFEWLNETFYDGAYQRTESYFGNSRLSAQGRMADEIERRLLVDSGLSDTVFEVGYRAPLSDGSGRDRQNRRAARTLLRAAGCHIVDGRLVDKNGTPVHFEVLVQNLDDQRIALAWRTMLAREGISLDIRLVDSSQYQTRLQNFDFDAIFYEYYASLSPGNEQAHYWGSAAADTPGSRNYAGIKNPIIDRIISVLTAAHDLTTFTSAARALDRALMGGHYFVPLFHARTQWVATWKHIAMPEKTSLYGIDLTNWWYLPKP